jgi:hypothetical protein
MPVRITRVPADDDTYDETWERITDQADLYGIDAGHLADTSWWQVGVAAAEFIRGPHLDGLQAEFQQRIAAALAGVPGVQRADQEDTEVWVATGQPASARALIEAVAAVLDDMAPRLRPHIYPPQPPAHHNRPRISAPPPDAYRRPPR